MFWATLPERTQTSDAPEAVGSFLRPYSNNEERFSNLSCFCCLFDISCWVFFLKQKHKNVLRCEYWGAWRVRKSPQKAEKSTCRDLMSSSCETNPLVPRTERDLFIRTNIDEAARNMWGFSNQSSICSRPELLPEYDPVTKVERWQPQHEKSPSLCGCPIGLLAETQQRFSVMTDPSSVKCVFRTDWWSVAPSATLHTWFPAALLRHKAEWSISHTS